MNKEQTLKSKYIYYGNILKLRVDNVKLANKKETTREIVEHNGSVCILAITNKNEVVMVRQYRYAFQKELLELPAGKIDKGETHFETAKRELFEETGISADDLNYLGEIYPSVGYTTEVIHLYYTTGVEVNLDHQSEEIGRIEVYSLDELYEMISINSLVDAKSICALLKYKLHVEHNN